MPPCHVPSLGQRVGVPAAPGRGGGGWAGGQRAGAGIRRGTWRSVHPAAWQPRAKEAVAGSGAGYYSPNSPTAPLPVREAMVPWSVLTDLTKKTTVNAAYPVQRPAGTQTRRQHPGFHGAWRMPNPTEALLLTSVPLTLSVLAFPAGLRAWSKSKPHPRALFCWNRWWSKASSIVLPNDPADCSTAWWRRCL